MLFWIIIIALGVAIGLGLYFFPLITLKILGAVAKVLVLATFGLVKMIVTGISTSINKIREVSSNRRIRNNSPSTTDKQNSNSPNVTTVTNVNINGSRAFISEDEIPSDLDTKIDESNLIKKDDLFTR